MVRATSDVESVPSAALQLREAGIRLTPQRQAILEYLQSTTEHPRAEDIYERVRRTFPGISLGTVYNTLNLLAERGLIRALPHPDKTARFDGKVHRHYHVVCEKCGRVHDFEPADSSCFALMEEEVASQSGYRILRHEVEFVGVCPACRSEEAGRTESTSA